MRRGKKLRTTIADMRMATWQHEHDGHPVAPGQLTQHHDAGSQYTSLLHTEHLAAEGIADSVGSVGAPYDNALMESMIGLYRPSEDPRR